MDRLIVRHSAARRAVAFAPVILLVVLGIACVFAYRQLRRTREAVGGTREARLAAAQVMSDLKDAETGQRGFLLLGDPSYLEPYMKGRQQLARDTVLLRERLAPSRTQQQRLQLLRENIDDRVAILDSTITLGRAGNLAAAAAIVRGGHGRIHMNRIRELIAAMDAEERDSLAVQLAAERRAGIALILLFTIGLAVTIVTSLLVNRAMLRYTREREEWLRKVQEQNAQLQEQNEQLQEQSAELEAQYDSLQEQAAELEAQHSELEMQNEELQLTNEALHEARLQAEHANAAKTAFLTSMSHELRTPLNAIAGYTDLIEAGVYGRVSERLLDAARRIHINEEQLLSIINQILDYTGIKSQTQPIAIESVDVYDVLEKAEAVVAPMLRAKGLRYTLLSGEAERPFVLGNAGRLRQVLVNLLGNAVKFTNAPGEIAVVCQEVAGRVGISVRDTGVGISANDIGTIFEPFVQVGGPIAAGTSSGVGLGLAISRELVEAMGGQLTVESEPNVGSVFTITLPSASAIVQAERVTPSPPDPRAISANPI